MDNCIFCKIVKKEIPSFVIYETDNVIAILDISQGTKGHTIVMSKDHYSNILDMPDLLSNELMEVTKKVSSILINKLKAAGINILSNINSVAGQVIFHDHIHVIPRYVDNDVEINIPNNQNKCDLVSIHELLIK